MKPISGLLALFMFAAAGSHAVTLNTDALKSMQEEGHKIVEEAQNARAFRSNTGQCLDLAGKALLIKNCDARAASQKWYFDDKDRLVAHDGRCVDGNGQLAACGGGKGQQWQLDGKNRLANGAGQCLQPQGNPPKSGVKVASVACSGNAQQVWR